MPRLEAILFDEPLPVSGCRSVFVSLSPRGDPLRAPEGFRAVTIATHTPVEPWWATDRDRYEEMKGEVAEAVLDRVASASGLGRLRVEAMLSGTPRTFVRFTHRSRGRVGGVGFAGGFLEALSGVWGPLVTSNLVAFGTQPRYAVGTGSIAETFVAGAVFAVLVSHIGFDRLSAATVGLIGGALVAAPLAARIARDVARRPLMVAVGVMVIVLSFIRLFRDLGF